MPKRNPALPIFFFVLIVTIIIFTLSQKHLLAGVGNVVNSIFSPIRFAIVSLVPAGFHAQTTLVAENNILRQQLVDQKKLEQEDVALKDQFQTTSLPSSHLLPVQIIGKPSFLPGFTLPENFIINKGKSDGLHVGQAVIYQNNLVGKITDVRDSVSSVTLVTNKKSSFTAQTSSTQALGIVKGAGNGEMTLDNVLLSDHIKVNDTVITNGNVTITGIGYPPGLIVGKVLSVEKDPSALFQSANVRSLLDFTRLTTVFIITQQ